MSERTYVCIDLKSFYASVECRERDLDPLTTNLVVADVSRTEKTICLAVSPALKEYGIPGRARLFEVVQKVKEVNAARRGRAPGRTFTGKSADAAELAADPGLELTYIAAVPQMSRYMSVSTDIYRIYLRTIAAEDIHVYSIDEVFMDVTAYLNTYGCSARELAERMIHDVYRETGITATAGIGPNMYLAKIAMDIVAKHVEADADGVRIAEMDEMAYRKQLWSHTPITDFWRVGRGTAKRLAKLGMYTMGDVARCSLGDDRDFYNEDLLYKTFGVNAELLIDHAWGYEPCTMADIKAYQPEKESMGAGQVLMSPYPYEKAMVVIREMAEQLAYDLLRKEVVSDRIVVTVGYDMENLQDPDRAAAYRGPVVTDFYGRLVPKAAHGTAVLERKTSSAAEITEAVEELCESILDRNLLVRRITLAADGIIPEKEAEKEAAEAAENEQLNLFVDYDAREKEAAAQKAVRERERAMQKAVLSIKDKFGKNAIVKGRDLTDGATAMQRNGQIGGHKA